MSGRVGPRIGRVGPITLARLSWGGRVSAMPWRRAGEKKNRPQLALGRLVTRNRAGVALSAVVV
jgi:hypothetical protein